MTWQIVKIIALVSMTLDHTASTFITQPFLIERLGMSMASSYQLLSGMHMIGRMAFPIYAFGISQGCTYTKDRKKFLLRLLIFAVLAEIPFQLAFSGDLHFFPLPISNVLFTLLLGALSCFLYDFFRKKGKAWITTFPVLFFVLLAEICRSDYGGMGVLCVFVPYLFKDKKWKLASIAALVLRLYLPFTLHSVPRTLFALAGVAVLAFYNGEKGRQSKFSQLFFYAYYPLHLLVFWGIAQWTGPITLSFQ